MTAPFVFTYADVLVDLEYFSRSTGIGADQTLQRICVAKAYRDITTARAWTCLHDNERIQLRVPQTTGTVVFDLTGGTYERQLTLTDATWPEAWCRDASVRFDGIVCDIEDYKTSTVVTLDVTMAPIADVASTIYSLFPRWYALPNDFLSMDLTMGEDPWDLGKEVSKAEIERLIRSDSTTGSVRNYAIANVPDLYGAMGLFVHPPSDSSETLDIPYRKRPRPLVYTGHDGLIDCKGTIVATSGSATVAGTDTAFASGMAGSLLRVGTSTQRPTGVEGQYPYGEVYSIKSVESATSLTLSSNATTTRTDVAYSITDPVDLDAAVYNAFVACAQKYLAQMLRAKNLPEVRRQYKEALDAAKQADFREHAPVIAGAPRPSFARLADSPLSRRTVVE